MNFEVKLRGWRTKFTVQAFRGFGIYAQFENGDHAGKFDARFLSSPFTFSKQLFESLSNL